MFGVVYSKTTGRIRSIIHPDSDSELNNIPVGIGEASIKLDNANYLDLDTLQTFLSSITGITPSNDRYAVVDSQGVVIGAVIADITIDAVPGAQLIKHPSASTGWTWSADAGFTAPLNPTDPILLVGESAVPSGSVVTLVSSLRPYAALISSFQFNLTLLPGVTFVSAAPAQQAIASGKNVSSNVVGNLCTILVVGLNQTIIAQGPVVTLQFTFDARTLQVGKNFLQVSNVIYSDPNGQTIKPGVSEPGAIVITVASAIIP